MLKKGSIILSVITGIVLYLVISANSSLDKPYLRYLWLIIVMGIGSFIIYTFLLFLLVTLYGFVAEHHKTRKKLDLWIFNVFVKYLIDMSGTKVTIEGLDKLPKQKAMIIGNHVSNFDPMVIAYYLRKMSIVSISKPENFKIPICGPYIKALEYIAIDRSNPRQGLEVVNKAVDFIEKDKYSVCIFPEGTRNKKADCVLPFHHGTFKIATRSHCPIVVCSIKNTNLIHKNFPLKRTKVTFKVLKVLNYVDYENLSTAEIADLTYDIVRKDLGY